MLIVANLDGYSSSSREHDLRLSTHVHKELNESAAPYRLFSRRSRICLSSSSAARDFVKRHMSPDHVLLCTGKSLGARNIVRYVLNIVGPLSYRRIYVLTVDPCWPLWWSWAPNLSCEELHLTRFVTHAINIHVIPRELDQQCGARLAGFGDIENRAVIDATHGDISGHPVVREALRALIGEASQ